MTKLNFTYSVTFMHRFNFVYLSDYPNHLMLWLGEYENFNKGQIDIYDLSGISDATAINFTRKILQKVKQECSEIMQQTDQLLITCCADSDWYADATPVEFEYAFYNHSLVLRKYHSLMTNPSKILR